jgi:hypothetical protein
MAGSYTDNEAEGFPVPASGRHSDDDGRRPGDVDRPQAAFYYDVGSPDAYLAAERVVGVLGTVPEFIPVRIGGPGGFRCAEEETIYRSDIERRAADYGLMPVRWPAEFPADSEWAMLVATFAKQTGRVVAFSMAAFRQAFAGGRGRGARRRDPRSLGRGRARRAGAARRRPRLPRRPRARARRGGARVKANREYELLVRRGGHGPAALADPDRVDQVEIVEIATGEVALFWDTAPAQTGRLSRALKTDLSRLEAGEFMRRWRRWEMR